MRSWKCIPSHTGGSSRFIEGGSQTPPPFSSERITFFFGTKCLIPYEGIILPYQELIFRELRDFRTRKFVDKYLLRIFRLYPFVHNELAISGRTTDWET